MFNWGLSVEFSVMDTASFCSVIYWIIICTGIAWTTGSASTL